MQLLVVSDIHGNLSALDAVMADVQARYKPDAAVVLGDSIDYGMRSSEVVERLEAFPIPVRCALWGNHESAILGESFEGFSSQRGVDCARFTASQLSERARLWLADADGKGGLCELEWAGYRVLAVHGSIADPFWGKIAPSNDDFSAYKGYDMVLSGHSHIPHAFSVLVPDEESPLRGKRALWFLNPGSVGQPRNHDPRASYAVWDVERGISLNTVPYDVSFEQSLYDGSVDDFYRARLAQGI